MPERDYTRETHEWFSRAIAILRKGVDWKAVEEIYPEFSKPFPDKEKLKSIVNYSFIKQLDKQGTMIRTIIHGLKNMLYNPIARGRLQALGINPEDMKAKLEIYEAYPKRFKRHIRERKDCMRILEIFIKAGDMRKVAYWGNRLMRIDKVLKRQQELAYNIADEIERLDIKSERRIHEMSSQAEKYAEKRINEK